MVISSSSVGRGWGKDPQASIEAVNLALDWFARTGKLDWDIYDSSTPPPSPGEQPEGMKWEFKNKWTLVEG